MGELVWEWTLATNDTVTARVDTATYVESIYVGQRLVARSGQAGKPEGHAITLGASSGAPGGYRAPTAQEVLVKFDAALCNFELRANGRLVAPSRAPTAPPPEAAPGRVYGHLASPSFAPTAPPPGSGSGAGRALKIGIGLAVALVVGGVVSRFAAGVTGYLTGARAKNVPAGVLTASTGLATIHHPAGFTVKEESKSASGPAGPDDECQGRTCTTQMSLVEMVSTTRDEGAFVASFKMNGRRIGRDPWRVSNLLHEKFSDLAKVHGAAYVETDRQDATCLGETGAVVIGRFTDAKSGDGTLWSCTFIRDGNAYWVGTFVNAKLTADEPALRKIIDATEIAPAR